MNVHDIKIIQCPGGKLRLQANVEYDTNGFPSEQYWFEVPESYEHEISTTGNPWLVCLLPLAVTLGEPIRISLPVDELLLENAEELMRIWKSWYPSLKVVALEVDSFKNLDPIGNRIAAFFSGGVDSFFTVLHNEKSDGYRIAHPVDDLLSIWGFDIPLGKPDAFARMKKALKKASGELNKNLICITTNIRETQWKYANWGEVSHGSGLASVAYVFEKRFRRVLIGSSSGYNNLHPWGSHPMTDPLLSSSNIKIVHDGGDYSRVMKTEFIAKSNVAREFLRVCWRGGDEKNCGNCSKCYRTMSTLEVLGVLSDFTTFSHANFSIERLSNFYLRSENDRSFFREIEELAIANNRKDIADAIASSLRRSEKLDVWLPRLNWLNGKRGMSRISSRIKRSVLKKCIIE